MSTHLQNALLSVLDGSHDYAPLEEAMQRARAELERARDQVGNSLRAEHEKVRAAVAPESNMVEECFQDYFRMIAACGHAPDLTLLDSLSLVQNRLNLALQRLRSVTLAERGPYTYPALNEVLQASSDLTAFQAAVDEHLEALEELLANPEVELLGEERTALQALLELLRSTPEGKLPDSSWMGAAHALGPQLARVDRDFFQRHFQGGPTDFPMLNLVIHGSHMVDQGRLSEEVWEYFVRDAKESLEGGYLVFEPILTLLDDPDLADQIPRLVEVADRVQRDVF